MKIEKNIPIPAEPEYPFSKMEIGDSMACDWLALDSADVYGRRRGKGFTYRKEGDGYRIWRIK